MHCVFVAGGWGFLRVNCCDFWLSPPLHKETATNSVGRQWSFRSTTADAYFALQPLSLSPSLSVTCRAWLFWQVKTTALYSLRQKNFSCSATDSAGSDGKQVQELRQGW